MSLHGDFPRNLRACSLASCASKLSFTRHPPFRVLLVPQKQHLTNLTGYDQAGTRTLSVWLSNQGRLAVLDIPITWRNCSVILARPRASCALRVPSGIPSLADAFLIGSPSWRSRRAAFCDGGSFRVALTTNLYSSDISAVLSGVGRRSTRSSDIVD